MKKAYLFTLLLLFVLPINAQVFEGTVTDEDGIPLSGANVYFNGSDIGRITNIDGDFSIQIPNTQSPVVVISYMGFENLYLEEFTVNGKIYVLKQNIDKLDEVLISVDTAERKRLLKAFLKNFLGENEFGKSCTIINMNDIAIHYDEAKKTIKALAKKPLIIENNLLNYRLTYDLQYFQAVYKRDIFRADNLLNSVYYGVSFFENRFPVTERDLEVRKEAYIGSIQHFFWSMLNDPKHEYTVFDGEAHYNPNQFLELVPTSNSKNFKIHFLGSAFREITKINEETLIKETYYALPLQVSFKKQMRSVIEFRSQQIKVDNNGNYSPLNGITMYGEMIDYKIGNMLPINFSFED